MATDTEFSRDISEYPPLLTEKEAAELTGLSGWWFQQHRSQGTGPSYIRIPPRAIRYERDKLLEWFRQFEVKNERV